MPVSGIGEYRLGGLGSIALWDEYVERLELYCEPNEHSKEEEKLVVLLSSCGEERYSLIVTLVKPDRPAAAAYDNIKKAGKQLNDSNEKSGHSHGDVSCTNDAAVSVRRSREPVLSREVTCYRCNGHVVDLGGSQGSKGGGCEPREDLYRPQTGDPGLPVWLGSAERADQWGRLNNGRPNGPNGKSQGGAHVDPLERDLLLAS
ncbi:hypothetical protein HPB49_025328 [Dermacentor silvarum]|uniref:Uncharacterized protein n=1 Tax=Dermacentor silvarum TaxID=543639 RepID=A0ACB8D1B8_DERSI|nr:hypothetical protein HPB49_025328 [Dermacentor silvarum]